MKALLKFYFPDRFRQGPSRNGNIPDPKDLISSGKIEDINRLFQHKELCLRLQSIHHVHTYPPRFWIRCIRQKGVVSHSDSPLTIPLRVWSQVDF